MTSQDNYTQISDFTIHKNRKACDEINEFSKKFNNTTVQNNFDNYKKTNIHFNIDYFYSYKTKVRPPSDLYDSCQVSIKVNKNC